jgi:DNA-binding XRE family transcriptional regulator
MTQDQFACLIGSSKRTIKRVEAGQPLDLIVRIGIVSVLDVVERFSKIKAEQA